MKIFKEFLFTILAAIFGIIAFMNSCILLAFFVGTIFTFFYKLAIDVSMGKMSGIQIGTDLAMNLIGCVVVSLGVVVSSAITYKCYKLSNISTYKKESEVTLCSKPSE
jgi:hypothetical protein